LGGFCKKKWDGARAHIWGGRTKNGLENREMQNVIQGTSKTGFACGARKQQQMFGILTISLPPNRKNAKKS